MTRRAVLACVAALCLTAAAVTAAVPALAASPGPTGSSATTPYDYRALALKVAYEINQARQHPEKLADDLTAIPTPTGNWAVLPSGSRSSVGSAAYLRQAAAEARTQPALPALAWSDNLAEFARVWAAQQNAGGVRSLSHGDMRQRKVDTKLNSDTPQITEALSNGDLDPKVWAYNFWVSGPDKWDMSAPFDPATSWSRPERSFGWRGHRGIINKQGVTAIGVGCAPFDDAGKSRAVCVVDTTPGMRDASPVTAASSTTSSSTTPDLSRLPAVSSGSLGSAAPAGTTVVVDTSSAASSSPPTQNTPVSPQSSDAPEQVGPPITSSTSAVPATMTPSAPVTGPSTPGTGSRCGDADATSLSDEAAARAVECLLLEARKNAGRAPFGGSSAVNDIAGQQLRTGGDPPGTGTSDLCQGYAYGTGVSTPRYLARTPREAFTKYVDFVDFDAPKILVAVATGQPSVVESGVIVGYAPRPDDRVWVIVERECH